ncbi:GntR family transcriptional regulator [Arcanobacterium hippocoleae]
MLSDKYLQVLFDNAAKSAQQLAAHSDVGVALSNENRSKSTMNAIKSYILANGLKPGDPLPTEAALCESLGVSRSSVREALRKLEALDIVTVHQGRGSFVGEMSLQPLVETLVLRTALQHTTGDQSLSEVVAVRRALDLGIAREIVNAMKGTKNPEIWDLVNRMAEKAATGESYFAEDIEFHSAIFCYLRNDLVQQLMSALWLINQTIIPKMNRNDGSTKINRNDGSELQTTAGAHRKMLAAAEAGDLESYIQAVEQHYAPLEALIATNQDYINFCRSESAE